MSVASVQTVGADNLSVSIDLDGDWGPLSAGNTVVVALTQVSGAGSLSVSDSSGNPYSVLNSGGVHLFYRRGVTGGETTVAVTVSGAAVYHIHADELSGVSPSLSVQTGTIGAIGSTTSHTCSSSGLTGTGYWIGGVNAGAGVAWTPGSGYTAGFGLSSTAGPLQYKIGAGSGDTGQITCSPATNIADGALLFLPETAGSSAVLTGTGASGMTEADVRAGGKTLIATLTGDTYVAAGGVFDATRQAIINGIQSAQSEATGWEAKRSLIAVTAVVRTSGTVVTVTLPAIASYDITASEFLTMTIPAAALVGGVARTVTPTFQIAVVDTTAPTLSAPTVGSLTASGGTPAVTTNEANGTVYMVIVPDGNTPSVAQIKLGQNSTGGAALAAQNQSVTTTGVQTFTAVTGLGIGVPYDCWFVHRDAASNDSTSVKADFTTSPSFNSQRQAIIDGFLSAQNEATGWNALKGTIPVTALVRTSSTVATLTLPAMATYNITSNETITVTVPGAVLTNGTSIVATPNVSIGATSGGGSSVGRRSLLGVGR